MHFHFRKENQGSESPPFCTAFDSRLTHMHHEQSCNSRPLRICRALLGALAVNNPGSRSQLCDSGCRGKGLPHRRTGLARSRQVSQGAQGSLNATSSSPRPLALVASCVSKNTAWFARMEAPQKALWNILCYTMEVAEPLREVSRAFMLELWCGVTTQMSNRLVARDDTRPPASIISVNLFTAFDGMVGFAWSIQSRCIACLTARQGATGSVALLRSSRSVVLVPDAGVGTVFHRF